MTDNAIVNTISEKVNILSFRLDNFLKLDTNECNWWC